MARVTIIMKNGGRKKTVDSTYARALIHIGKAVYADDYEKKVIEPTTYNNKTIKKEVVVEKTPAPVVAEKSQEDELATLRKAYQDKFNKKAYYGWNVEQLKAKLAQA